jgi:hypothetical protein
MEVFFKKSLRQCEYIKQGKLGMRSFVCVKSKGYTCGQVSKNQIFFPEHSTLALIPCPEHCNTFLGNLFAKIRYVCMYIYIYIYI